MKEKGIYEQFLNEDKSAYLIQQVVKKQNPNASYPPIHDMIVRLFEKGTLIEIQKEGPNPRKTRWFRITTTGLGRLYIFRRKDRKNLKDYEFRYRYSKSAKEVIDKKYQEDLDLHHSKSAKEVIDKKYQEDLEDLEDLDFHHSKDTKKIIDKIYQKVEEMIKVMYNVSFYDDGRGKLFKEALSVSPSLIKSFEKEEIKVRVIEDRDLFSNILKNNPERANYCLDIIPDKNLFLYKRYLGEMLPIECLARDYEKYKDDKIKILLGKYLLFLSKEEWKRKNERKAFNGMAKKLKKSCTNNWVLYIPPVGTPVLACKGCPEDFKK